MTGSRSPYAIYDADPPVGVPSVDIDPFSKEFFADPFPFHQRLRDAGPYVWLTKYSIGAVARHEHVRGALNDWKTFSSSRGVGMEDFERHGRFRLPSLILEADPPQHTRSRGVLGSVLSPPVLKRFREHFEKTAASLVDSLVQRRSFDGIKDLADIFPLSIFPDAIGIGTDARDMLLPHADLLFNSFGPRNEFFQAARTGVTFEWIEKLGRRENLSPDGIGMLVHQAADRGVITHEEAPLLVRALLQAGLDTTINAIGASVYCLARFPDQWEALVREPRLAPAAFDEAIRFESPVQTFFRTTTCSTTLGGSPLTAGEKVLIFLGAANRDPRRWADADKFDINRSSAGHVGFGAGIHACVGQMLAKLEGDIVLTALARRVKSISIAGPVERRYNNTLRGLAKLPLEVIPI